MRRTILQQANPLVIDAVKNQVTQEQKIVLPVGYRVRPTGIGSLNKLHQQTHPFATAVSLALSLGILSILVSQKNAQASATNLLIDLPKPEPSAVIPSRLIPTASPSENIIQSPRVIAKPLWVPRQVIVNQPVRSKPLITQINQASTTVAYQVQPEDTVETIASSYQISEQELIKVNRLHNPDVIRVDQVLAIPPSRLKSSYVVGGKDSVLPTSPSVITAAQPSGITLPILTSQAGNIPVPVAPTTDDSKFRVAAGVTYDQPQVPELVISAISRSESTVSPSNRISSNPSQRQVAEDLQSYIQNLQEKYSARNAGVQHNLQTVTIKLSVAAPSTLQNQGSEATGLTAIGTGELSSQQTKDLQLDIQKLQNKYRTAKKAEVQEPGQTMIALTPKQKPVATVSTRSNFSAPIVKRTGFPQLLNPELPPLSPLDTYLPDKDLTGSLQFVWPTKGVLTSGYGRRWGRMHRGIDVAGPIGTPVVAAALGVVVQSGWTPGGYGNVVNVLHPDGSLTRYAHNKKLLVRPGQEINQGQQIAEMGNSGRSTGPHLHFEIHPSGKGAVNPMHYLSRG